MAENKPYICPVCNGRGHVSNGFYNSIDADRWVTSSMTPDKCKSCDGTGIVWADVPEWCLSPNEIKMSQ